MIQIKLLTVYAPLQQLSSRDNDKTQTGKEWANQRQPYFLLMAVLGVDKEKRFPWARILDVYLWGWLSLFC